MFSLFLYFIECCLMNCIICSAVGVNRIGQSLGKKECIPVGCVPTAAVAATGCMGRGVNVCLHIHPPNDHPSRTKDHTPPPPPRSTTPLRTKPPLRTTPHRTTPQKPHPIKTILPRPTSLRTIPRPPRTTRPWKEHGTRQPGRK